MDKWVRTKSDEAAVDAGCWFDLKAAERPRTFFQRFLRHSKGEWAGKPFELLDWQWEGVIAPLFGWKRADGLRRFRKAGIWIAKKQGKALALDTPIPTVDGWKLMADVAPGDNLFDENGLPCRVVAVSPVMETRPCYEVGFDDGERIIADAEHLWVTQFRKLYGGKLTATSHKRTHGGKPAFGRGIGAYLYTGTHTTEQIADTIDSGNGKNHSVPVSGVLELPDRYLPIPPYVLGAWLGDGHSASPRLTCGYSDLQIVQRIKDCGVKVRENKSSNLNSGCFSLGDGRRGDHFGPSMKADLRRLGVLGNKYIPNEYLRASSRQRLELLQGLMDTDGHCSTRGQCEFLVTNAALAAGVMELVRTLGMKPRLSIGRATIAGRDCGPKYRVRFYPIEGTEVFGLKRKADRQYQSRQMNKLRSRSRQIVSIIPVASVPVKCIAVDSPSRLYLAGRSMVPTHNSALASAISLYMLIGDKEQGAEVYNAANDRDQAGIVFNEAANMVEASPGLMDKLEVLRSTKRIVFRDTHSWYRALSADVPTKEGINWHCLIFDELHAQKTRDLWDTLAYGGAARRQPLLLSISTAGYDKKTIGREQYEYAKGVLDGTIIDPTFLAYVAEATEDDDWKDEKVWHKANPSLGVTVKLDDMREACAEAQASPTKENAFRRYRLNQWTTTDVRWLPLESWDACRGEFEAADLEGRECFGGLDLASTTDLASLCLVFDMTPYEDADEVERRRYAALWWFWVPEDSAHQREKRDRVPYRHWIKTGLIEATEGESIDYDFIRKKINELGQVYNIRSIGIDRWNATQIAGQLQGDGFDVFMFGQGYASMTDPMKLLEALVLSRRIEHDGNEVARWQFGNLAVQMDAAGNIKPSKEKSTEKIDGMVALVMALGRALVAPEMQPAKVEIWG